MDWRHDTSKAPQRRDWRGEIEAARRTGLAKADRDGRPHLPRRPIWLCQVCATDWPCLTARTLLPLDYVADPVGLAVFLASAMQEAMADLHRLHPASGPDPKTLHARFLGWAAPRLRIARDRRRVGSDGGGGSQ